MLRLHLYLFCPVCAITQKYLIMLRHEKFDLKTMICDLDSKISLSQRKDEDDKY